MADLQEPGVGTEQSDVRRSRVLRAAALLATLVVLQWVMFRTYYSGLEIGPWDFVGAYNTDAYYWWTNGSWFEPVKWVPSVWAGYPAAGFIQNSSWYLPVGLASAVGPFTYHASAIVSALHIAFGSIGAYVLARHLRLNFTSSLFLACAWFFAAGYYSNASHLDIARGYAWIPWLLLMLLPSWDWRVWWRVVAGVAVFWQAIAGTYPGILVSFFYVGVPWVLLWQFGQRLDRHAVRPAPSWRHYLLPLAGAGLLGVLLNAPRLVPYFMLSDGPRAAAAESSVPIPELFGTLAYGYDFPVAPLDITMRSFFLPATVLVLAFWCRKCDAATWGGLVLMVPAVLLGLAVFPWFDDVQALPGMDLSRFSMSDFKPFMLLGAMLLAASGFQALQAAMRRERPRTYLDIPRVFASVALIAGLVWVGNSAPFDSPAGSIHAYLWVAKITAMLLTALGVIVLALFLARGRRLAVGVSALVIVGTAMSGYLWANANPLAWRTDRVAMENYLYGTTVADLIAQDDGKASWRVRPSRAPLAEDYTVDQLYLNSGNAAYYSGQLSLAGYINMKGFTTEAKLSAALGDPLTGAALAAFLQAPGRLLTVTPGATLTPDVLIRCASNKKCGTASIEPIRWSPGRNTVRVSAPSELVGIVNEAFYPGWLARGCSDGRCSPIVVSSSPQGLISLALPPGEYTLQLWYDVPGDRLGWAIWWACVGATSLWAGSLVFLRMRQNRRRSAAAPPEMPQEKVTHS